QEKKNELQSLATALGLKTEGTKEELHARLRNHLDKHQAELEEEPQFAGLFGRRKRKESVPPLSKRSTVDSERPLGRFAFLKNPRSPLDESPRRRTRSSLAIAESPSISSKHIPTPRFDGLLQVAKQKQEIAIQNVNKVLFSTRTLLSDSRTIGFYISFCLSSLWQYLHIPFTSTPAASEIPPSTVIPPSGSSHLRNFLSVTIPYPPLATFESRMFWTILMHCFKPAPPTSREISRIVRGEREQNDEEEEEEITQVQTEKSKLSIPFDPLTASIIQLAGADCVFHSPTSPTIKSVDVLGFRWRVLSASVGLAFFLCRSYHGRTIVRPPGDGSSEPSRSLELHRTIETFIFCAKYIPLYLVCSG
ncbi:hypothetical protein BDP27DRAFT_1317278, partial [Rhodocollybia butyracea]